MKPREPKSFYADISNIFEVMGMSMNMYMKHFSIAVALSAVVTVVLAVAIGTTGAQVVPMPGSAHSKLSCADCHDNASYTEINVSSIETCKKCHPKEVEETMSSKHAGLGATRPDTMPNTCLVCHNPHQGGLQGREMGRPDCGRV